MVSSDVPAFLVKLDWSNVDLLLNDAILPQNNIIFLIENAT